MANQILVYIDSAGMLRELGSGDTIALATVDGLPAALISKADVVNLVAQGTINIHGTDSGDANVALLRFYDSDGTTLRGRIGDANTTTDDIFLIADTGDVVIQAGGSQKIRAAGSLITLSGTVNIGGNAVDNTESDWINMTLINGWTSVSGRTAQYRRIGKYVQLRGAVQNTFANNNTVCWNCPAGYRPAVVRMMPATGGAFLAGHAIAYFSAVTQLAASDRTTASGTVSVALDNAWWSLG